MRARNLLLHPPATCHSSGGSAGPDWGTKAISVTHGQQCALQPCLFQAPSPHSGTVAVPEHLRLCPRLSGAQAPDCVFIIQQVEVAPQWGKSPVKNHSHGTVRESAAWCCSRLKGQTPLRGQVIERAHIQILKAAPNYQTHQHCRSN